MGAFYYLSDELLQILLDSFYCFGIDFFQKEDFEMKDPCTAYGFLDHSLKEDCATIQSQLKGVSNGETKKIHP